MSAAFTPGPWLVHATNRLICQANGALKPVRVENGAVKGDDLPNNICLLRDPDENFSEDETLANGFLIAAAPELYEALSLARMALMAVADSAVEAGFDRMADIIDDQLVKANAALAKARGDA